MSQAHGTDRAPYSAEPVAADQAWGHEDGRNHDRERQADLDHQASQVDKLIHRQGQGQRHGAAERGGEE